VRQIGLEQAGVNVNDPAAVAEAERKGVLDGIDSELEPKKQL
jgi:hypothetical protein